MSEKAKYISIFFFTFIVSVGVLSSAKFYIPEKCTQQMLLEKEEFQSGVREDLRKIEEKIQKEGIPPVDNEPYRMKTPNFEAVIVRTPQEKTSYHKYRVEIRTFYPHSVIPRPAELEAILLDLSIHENNEFADLFWKLK